ncbi:MAG TPA: nucleoside-diphosphate sugar epimerase/dehydratase, partial [Lentisphaeria bacterium]|nr:nucleoside-diphosphate sugar epimerase/dehydratase [Lentisphaeria bacterium]
GMLIGAGAAGQLMLRDFMTSKLINVKICCVIDDDVNKWNRNIEGVPIVGGRDDILYNVKKYNISKIFLAIPSASAQTRRDILNICNETGCELKTLPGIYQLVNDEITVSKMKPVAVEDLLGREQISINLDEICANLAGRVIMVTGGGGSIGSELCRQIAEHNPKQLIIFDLYENNAYDIQQELKMSYPELNLVTLIGSVRDSRRINQVFATWRPEIVFHAAAHKHVPLMEDSPCEAIKNNVLGTYKTAFAALAHGCRRFVLISTDKAVNPTNIMGASKRLCEMVIQTMDKVGRSGKHQCLPYLHSYSNESETPAPLAANPDVPPTEFVAVRFGNVLDSNGSVIPLFKKQIERGGPVTVTHPDIIRYFMTIPEAVGLVLQASVYANGGEIFVLDMGAPVKIDTLARNLIKLCGYKPDADIKIEYIGLRAGEKLYEEKLMDEEGLQTTPNKLIHIGMPIEIDTELFLRQLKELAKAAYANDPGIAKIVESIVPTYSFSARKQDKSA